MMVTSAKKSPGRKRVAAVRSRAAASAGQRQVRLGPLGEWIGFNLRLAQAASFQAFAREARNYDLPRPGWFATLVLIGENPGITQTLLSQASGCDKSTLTPVLAMLSQRGLVRRVQARHDRRNYHLTLTPSGQRAMRALLARARRHERNLDRVIGKAERATFLRILKDLSRRLV